MSNKNSNIISLIMAFIFLAVIVGVIYSLGHQLIAILADPKSKVGAPLIVTAGTILVSVLSVTLSRYLEGRAVIQKEQREKKNSRLRRSAKIYVQSIYGC